MLPEYISTRAAGEQEGPHSGGYSGALAGDDTERRAGGWLAVFACPVSSRLAEHTATVHAHSAAGWNGNVAIGAAPMFGQLALMIAPVRHVESRHENQDRG